MNRLRLLAIACGAALWLCTPLAASAASQSDLSGGLLAAADGHGGVHLIWFPPLGRMPPGGWRLSEIVAGQERVLVGRIAMGDPAALGRLPAHDAASIREFPQSVARATKPGDLRDVYGVLGLGAFTNSLYARAAGLAWTLSGASGGLRRYRVTGLNEAGSPVGPALESAPVDPGAATPLPPAPQGVHGAATIAGVELFWNPAAPSRAMPVIAYAIERDGGGQHAVAVTTKPLVLPVHWLSRQPEFIDGQAPGDAQLTYRVFALDAFGRRSAPGSATFYALDMKAIAPVSLSASAGLNETVLHWKPRENRHTSGYVVERSNLYYGPYVPLTFKALAATTGTYTDHSLRGGTVYYYRVLAVSPRGDLGPPSLPAMAQPKNATLPAQATGLQANVGRSRVHLTWRPSASPIAGFFVQRRARQAARWETLNAKVTPAPFYDDYFPVGTVGTLSYRILSVGFDNKEGPPSQEVAVELADTSPPAAPYVREASGRGGVVIVSLAAAAPASKTARILAVRSGVKYRMGLVIGDPLPGNARAFVDRHVQPGQDYWYRFVALDRNGNRSQPSDPIIVHVASPPLPTPLAPMARFLQKPFPHVELSFAPAPHGLAIILQRRSSAKQSWLLVAGPMPKGTKAVDADPPSHAALLYRLVFVAGDGSRSTPSEAASVAVP